MDEIIIIEKDAAGSRLDKYLADRYPFETRSQIKKAILDGQILVNKKTASVHRFLKAGDELSVNSLKAVQKSANPSASGKTRVATGEKLFKKIKIVAETPDYLIIEKPSGLLVHPTDKNETDTLVDWLISYDPKIRKIGESPERAGIVHRLDKEVSGLMAIPRTQAMFDSLKKQFKLHTITKKYVALVNGSVERDEGEITLPIGRSKTRPGLYAARPLNQDGKPAHTIFRVTQRYRKFTLLEVEILTGRTHQIRVHLLSQGYPIVGDKLYNTKQQEKNGLGRIFLHAMELSFTELDGALSHFKSKLPSALATYLNELKPAAAVKA